MVKLGIKIIPTAGYFSALVIDVLDGERVLVLNRFSGDKVCQFLVKDGLNTRIMPLQYSASPELAIIMFDDDNQYNATITDNVQAMVINTLTFDPLNPQPSELPA